MHFMNPVLLALALSAFAVGSTEFTPMGLLPLIGDAVHVSVPTAGMLITAYAAGVMVAAPIMTLLLGRFRRKQALLVLMGIFVLGNAMSALASTYSVLLISRLITSLTHGACFGFGSVVATESVSPNRKASAVATMFMGLTVANIFGVPSITWIGHAFGWRTAFWVTAGIGVIACAAFQALLPRGTPSPQPDVRAELRVLTRPAVLRALLTTVLGAGAMFTLYTYIAATLMHLNHASAGFITAMLIVVGLGFTVGNMLSGRFSDAFPRGTLLGSLLLLAVMMALLPWLLQTQAGAAIGLFLWGAAAFAVVPPVQMRVMHEAHDAPGLAASVNIGAFNLGNALGAALGGAVISAGAGYAWVAPAGGGMALLGCLVAALSVSARKTAAA